MADIFQDFEPPSKKFLATPLWCLDQPETVFWSAFLLLPCSLRHTVFTIQYVTMVFIFFLVLAQNATDVISLCKYICWEPV